MKVAKIFQNGQSQAVRLPKEFRLAGKQVFIKRIGEVVMLIPEDNSWRSLTDSLNLFSDDFMTTRKQPRTEQKRESFFE